MGSSSLLSQVFKHMTISLTQIAPLLLQFELKYGVIYIGRPSPCHYYCNHSREEEGCEQEREKKRLLPNYGYYKSSIIFIVI